MPTIDKKYYHNIDLANNELKAGRIYNVISSQRTALASFFIANPTKDYNGYVVYDLTNYTLYIWNGSTNTWDTVGGSNGIPAGGTTGQILAKIDGTDYSVEWIDNYTSQVRHEVKLGESINKGQAVYVSGSNGTNMIVSKASNTSEPTSSKTMGLLITSGVTNDFRYIITEGLLAGTGSEPLNTNSANAGDPVWLGTNGDLIYGLTNKPSAPNHLVYIGVVTRKSATVGEIFVKIQNGFELKELHDVQATAPTLKDTLYYDNNVSPPQWKTGSISAILGYAPIQLTSLNASSPLNYDNTSGVFSLTGTVSVLNGGTGLSSYTKGDMLYASASNTIGVVQGNTSTTKKFLSQTGTGTASNAPVWDTISASSIDLTGITGDVTFSSGSVSTIGANKVIFSKMQTIAAQTILGNKTVSSGNIAELLPQDVATLLPVFGPSTKGVVPAATTPASYMFLAGDGSWQKIPLSGSTAGNPGDPIVDMGTR